MLRLAGNSLEQKAGVLMGLYKIYIKYDVRARSPYKNYIKKFIAKHKKKKYTKHTKRR